MLLSSGEGWTILRVDQSRLATRVETMATLRSATPSQEELLAAVALDIQAMTQHKQNPLGATAQAAADAGKEGGFLGFGGEQLSAGDQRMLDQVRAALEMA
jgi:hypothetical protein